MSEQVERCESKRWQGFGYVGCHRVAKESINGRRLCGVHAGAIRGQEKREAARRTEYEARMREFATARANDARRVAHVACVAPSLVTQSVPNRPDRITVDYAALLALLGITDVT